MRHWWCKFLLVSLFIKLVYLEEVLSDQKNELSIWEDSWESNSMRTTDWSLENRIPMTAEFDAYIGRKGKLKMKKKIKQLIMPLLLAYKLKFFALIPILVGGLLLLVTSTGLAGFFFALFAAAMGLKSGWHR